MRVKRDYQLVQEDFEERHLIFSLGGDGTFLKTASMVHENTMPVLGVNTDPTRSVEPFAAEKLALMTEIVKLQCKASGILNQSSGNRRRNPDDCTG